MLILSRVSTKSVTAAPFASALHRNPCKTSSTLPSPCELPQTSPKPLQAPSPYLTSPPPHSPLPADVPTSSNYHPNPDPNLATKSRHPANLAIHHESSPLRREVALVAGGCGLLTCRTCQTPAEGVFKGFYNCGSVLVSIYRRISCYFKVN